MELAKYTEEKIKPYKKLQKALEMLLEVEQETGIKFEILHKQSDDNKSVQK